MFEIERSLRYRVVEIERVHCNTFMESKIVFEIRKLQKLKSYEVTLPGVTDRKRGFHIDYYQLFIAVPKIF